MYRLGDEDDAEEEAILFSTFDRIEAKSAERQQSARRKKLLYIMAGAAAVVVLVLVISLAATGAAHARSQNASAAADGSSSAPPLYIAPDERGAAYNISFFVIGDWGRKGSADQRLAARMMADVAASGAPPAFIVSTGDNFYDHGLTGDADPQVRESFTDVYSAPSLRSVPWYAALGNHDYNDGIDPTSNTACAARTLAGCPSGCCYSTAWQFTGTLPDARWHARNGVWRVPTGAPASLLDIIVLDTSPLLSRYEKEPWYGNAGGLWQQNATAIKLATANALASSVSKWRFVVGHHPVVSFGSHCYFAGEGDCEEMAWLDPLLRNASVAAYLCGHDHSLQHVTRADAGAAEGEEQPPQTPVYVVSGAGSKVRAGEARKYRAREGFARPYAADEQGFVLARVNDTALVLHYYAAATKAGPAYTAVLSPPPAAAAAAGARG